MNPLARDLDHIMEHTQGLWEELRGQRIFITGGTGFFGMWLLESFNWANSQLKLESTAVVLSRNPEAFRRKAPHLAGSRAIQLHAGDLRSFTAPAGEFSHIIHAAVESSGKLESALTEFETNVEGTRRALDVARRCGARKLLFTSSGAVYGKQPSSITHVSEDYIGAPSPTDPATSYGQAKRAGEYLCTAYAREYGFEAKIARCFAFVGPHLPLESNYAIGNFIRDALRGGPVLVNGDGTPYRSYLYAADLMIWLWTILFRGESGKAYNVGSDADLTIADLSHRVADAMAPAAAVRIARQPTSGSAPLRYVPNVDRARSDLGLETRVALDESIRRSVLWYRNSAPITHQLHNL